MIRVTCAVIRNEEDDILVVQRGGETDHPFKWEFPGGKLAGEETDEECVIREVREELSMEIIICGKLPEVEYDYGHKQIKLIPFVCDTLDEIPFLSEHLAYKWADINTLKSVDFSEADIFVAESYSESINPVKAPQYNVIQQSTDESIDDSDLKSMINSMMSIKEADWLATSAIENTVVFQKLLGYSFSPDKKLAFHASWTLSKACDKYPELIHQYLYQIVDSLGKIDNESSLRSFLRIISLSDLSKIDNARHGVLADYCFGALNSQYSAIAVKAYSMEILYRLSVVYPELATELSASIRLLMEDGSAGITARGRNILKKLAEIPIDPGSSHL
jgi:8-oxo-dGTP diphosphatase